MALWASGVGSVAEREVTGQGTAGVRVRGTQLQGLGQIWPEQEASLTLSMPIQQERISGEGSVTGQFSDQTPST